MRTHLTTAATLLAITIGLSGCAGMEEELMVDDDTCELDEEGTTLFCIQEMIFETDQTVSSESPFRAVDEDALPLSLAERPSTPAIPTVDDCIPARLDVSGSWWCLVGLFSPFPNDPPWAYRCLYDLCRSEPDPEVFTLPEPDHSDREGDPLDGLE